MRYILTYPDKEYMLKYLKYLFNSNYKYREYVSISKNLCHGKHKNTVHNMSIITGKCKITQFLEQNIAKIKKNLSLIYCISNNISIYFLRTLNFTAVLCSIFQQKLKTILCRTVFLNCLLNNTMFTLSPPMEIKTLLSAKHILF